MTMMTKDAHLKEAVEALYIAPQRNVAALDTLTAVRQRLSQGTLRVAEKHATWEVHPWVKKAILLMHALGQPARTAPSAGGASGIELDTMPWSLNPPAHCRMPLGTLVREGAYIGEGVHCMPPAVLQIGCHIGKGAVIDSMVTIGIGAQIGEGAQLSCGAIVGGYIVPLDRLPTIVEDRVLMGSNSAVYDGVQVGEGAILLAGTQVLPATGLYDLATEAMVPLQESVLRVPPNAIVGMGMRPVGKAGVQMQIAIILGRRRGSSPKDWEMYLDLPLIGHAAER